MRILALLALACVACSGPARPERSSEDRRQATLEEQIRAVRGALDAVDDDAGPVDTGLYDRIGEAIDCLEVSREAGSTAWKADRAVVLELYLALLNKIDERIRRDFDFKDQPLSVVSPPDRTGLPPGTDPAEIKDGRLRAMYERAIQANDQRKLEYQRQVVLHRSDRLWTERARDHAVRTFIAGEDGDYKPATGDREELVAAVSRHASDAGRRKAFLESIELKSTPAKKPDAGAPR